MAVTADITYKGVPLTGIEFAVTRAEHIESADKSVLVYRCTVTMPDGSVQGDTGWETVSSSRLHQVAIGRCRGADGRTTHIHWRNEHSNRGGIDGQRKNRR